MTLSYINKSLRKLTEVNVRIQRIAQEVIEIKQGEKAFRRKTGMKKATIKRVRWLGIT